jgi:tetratricopeptide (TPR) repeat protein
MKRKIIGSAIAKTLLIALCCQIVKAQGSYKMQPVQMKTRWANQVSPQSTHNEYPRPQLSRSNWVNLNGLWEYAITGKDVRDYSKADGKILVPYPIESALSGVKKTLFPDQLLWYKRKFTQSRRAGERIILHFGAVDWQANVYVNGKEIGSHTGGYTSFSFDVTNVVKSGENELMVKVFDPSDRGIGPHGKQVLNPENIYYTPSSGIWQTVWIETVPSEYIENLQITPDIDKAEVKIIVKANKDLPVTLKFAGVTVSGKSNNVITLPIKNQRLWSPDDPYLYDLTVKLGKDKVKSYFGMRKVSIGKDKRGFDRILLNNNYTYNLGTLDQGFWPDGLYTAPNDEALAFDIKAIKAMGFNTIRKHIKVEPARWYYHADKIGMLIWQDMVNPNQGLPEGSKQEFEKESAEIIKQLYNYPSITTWVLFNEKWGQYDQERLTKWLKSADPSRIVNGHSGEYLYVNNKLRSPSPNAYVDADMTDVHSYPNPMQSAKQEGKAQVCGEFGGIGVPVAGHQWNDLTGWGYIQVTASELENKYQTMVNQLKQLESQGLSGSIYTQPFDVEGEENGLMTYDREITKIPVANLRRIHSTIVDLKNEKQLQSLNIGKEIDVKDNDERFKEFQQEFVRGRKDSVFLRRLVLMAMRKNNESTFIAAKKAFSSQMISPNSPSNVAFLNYTVKYLEDKINKELSPLLLDLEKVPDVTKIENDIISKYGDEGEKAFLVLLAFRYYNLKQYDLWFPLKIRINNKYPGTTSLFDLNNDAWLVFENFNKKEELEEALKWSKQVIDVEGTANYYDTYANLLYKIGKKKEAISILEKGLVLPLGNGSLDELKDHLEKMKADLPTWPSK